MLLLILIWETSSHSAVTGLLGWLLLDRGRLATPFEEAQCLDLLLLLLLLGSRWFHIRFRDNLGRHASSVGCLGEHLKVGLLLILESLVETRWVTGRGTDHAVELAL